MTSTNRLLELEEERKQIIAYTKIRLNFKKAKLCETCHHFDDYDNECDKHLFNVGCWNVCDDWR